MTGRKCSTCKHYDPAPIWRKGWCRNPLLYSPQQSHLVGEDDLDCEFAMGDYWESAEPLSPTLPPSGVPASPSDIANEPGSAFPLHLMTRSGERQIYPVTGSSGYRDDPGFDEPIDDTRAETGGTGRQIDYYTEERYWTDYLRIILPILGVLLFLVLLYLWALAFLRGDDEDPSQGGVIATSTIPMITAEATATNGGGATGTPDGPSIVLTPAPIGTESPSTDTTPIPTQLPSDEPADIAIGAIVQVANTGGVGANLRSLPTTDSDVITVLLDGETLEVIDGPEEALGFIWWNVAGAEVSGWVVSDYLEVVE